MFERGNAFTPGKQCLVRVLVSGECRRGSPDTPLRKHFRLVSAQLLRRSHSTVCIRCRHVCTLLDGRAWEFAGFHSNTIRKASARHRIRCPRRMKRVLKFRRCNTDRSSLRRVSDLYAIPSNADHQPHTQESTAHVVGVLVLDTSQVERILFPSCSEARECNLVCQHV